MAWIDSGGVRRALSELAHRDVSCATAVRACRVHVQGSFACGTTR